MRRWSRDRDVRPLSDVLPRTNAFRVAPVPPGLGSDWVEVLGAASKHAVLERLAGGVLFVRTESANWTHQLEALAEERFHVLPHADVQEYVKRKGADVDRWLSGMQRWQAQLFSENEQPALWLTGKR